MSSEISREMSARLRAHSSIFSGASSSIDEPWEIIVQKIRVFQMTYSELAKYSRKVISTDSSLARRGEGVDRPSASRNLPLPWPSNYSRLVAFFRSNAHSMIHSRTRPTLGFSLPKPTYEHARTHVYTWSARVCVRARPRQFAPRTRAQAAPCPRQSVYVTKKGVTIDRIRCASPIVDRAHMRTRPASIRRALAVFLIKIIAIARVRASRYLSHY